jgi:hypothetical protein
MYPPRQFLMRSVLLSLEGEDDWTFLRLKEAVPMLFL